MIGIDCQVFKKLITEEGYFNMHRHISEGKGVAFKTPPWAGILMSIKGLMLSSKHPLLHFAGAARPEAEALLQVEGHPRPVYTGASVCRRL